MSNKCTSENSPYHYCGYVVYIEGEYTSRIAVDCPNAHHIALRYRKMWEKAKKDIASGMLPCNQKGHWWPITNQHRILEYMEEQEKSNE